MAKKIRKHRMSLGRLMILLMLPWLVLGALAAIVFTLGGSDIEAIAIGLLGSLVMMLFVRRSIPKGRPQNP